MPACIERHASGKPIEGIAQQSIRTHLALGLATGLAQQAVLSYTVAVNPADLSSVQITMRVRNPPKVFHLAMVNHFLVDDAYWRFVEDLQISPGTAVREQDGL